MRINFLCNPVFGGWAPLDRRLGGTEDSIVQWAEELTKRGHEVTVFHNRRSNDKGVYKNFDTGVFYAPREHYEAAKHDKNSFWDTHYADICINIKSPEVPPKEPTLYLTNEVNADQLDLSAYAGVIFPSQWAVDNIPVNNKTFILPHGYDDKKIYPKPKVKKQCLYASSPDRGLKSLEQIWPIVVENHPEAHLYVTYGGKIDTPNTTCGEFTEEEMDELFNTSEFWLHPASGGELYCISGIKAQAAQTIPVYFPIMALQETVKVGEKCGDARDMCNKLISLLGDDNRKEKYRKELSKQSYPTWEDSTDKLLQVIREVVDS